MTPKQQLSRNLKIMTVTVFGIGLGVTILFSLIFVFARREQARLVEEQVTNHIVITELESAFGYGGMIHNFKNWILRPGETRNRDRAAVSANKALLVLDKLEKLAQAVELDVSLDAQRMTIAAYLGNLDLVARLHAEGATAREIDSAVRVDDNDALGELAVLRQQIAEKMRLQQAAVVDRRNLLLLLPSALIVLMLCGQLLLMRQRARLRIEFDRMRLEEMEQFTQIAAHDLRTPLLHISSLAGFALEDLQAESGTVRASVSEHLQTILGRVRKLDELIKAVFRYIQVEGASQEIVEVDLRRLVEEIGELHVPKDGTLRLEGGFPVVRAQRVELEIILRNLISNAVKHHPEKAPLIVLRHSVEGKRHRFEVEDNGPGIAQEHAEKVFGMFWSLEGHQNSEEVSGVGLAVVRRIITRWGTEMTLRNAKPSGAVFSFTMPMA